MHTVWKGSISFGLVNIPIRMFTATEERDIRFRQLHLACNTPIKYSKMCPTCEKEVETNEIVRGYEYEKGNFVIVKDEDLDKITPETRKAIEIVDFVNLEEIDPIYFDKSYFLAPQETGDKAYALLRKAMERTRKIAVAKITIRNRESLAVVRIYQNGLVLETIYYPDEVRSIDVVPNVPKADLGLAENELSMAEALVTNMSTTFDPTKYMDTYRADLQEFIKKKMEGQEITTAPSAPKANVVDLMQALKESLAAATQSPHKEATNEPIVGGKTASPKPPIEVVETYPSKREKSVKKRSILDDIKDELDSEHAQPNEATSTTKKLRRKKVETP